MKPPVGIVVYITEYIFSTDNEFTVDGVISTPPEDNSAPNYNNHTFHWKSYLAMFVKGAECIIGEMEILEWYYLLLVFLLFSY